MRLSLFSGVASISFDASAICEAIKKILSERINEMKEETIRILEDTLLVVCHGFYRLLCGTWRLIDSYTDNSAKTKPRQISPFPICVRLLDTVYRECTGKYRKTYLRRPQDRSENGSSVYSFPVVTAHR